MLHATAMKQRSHDTHYPYRQNSHFYYMCGFKEDKSALVFLKTSKKTKVYLFVHKKDPIEEMWNGKRTGVKKAQKIFEVDGVFVYEQLQNKLKEFSQKTTTLYYDFGHKDIKDSLSHTFERFHTLHDISLTIAKMRLIKSPAEVALIQKAIDITTLAHHRVMQQVQTFSYEYEIQAELEYVFKKNGAYSDAYTSIVACGDNANTLHYIANNEKINPKALILIDAGCEYEYYASDITRTIPASGRFSQPQRELYSLVLEVQKEIIAMVKPGILRSDLQKKTQKLLCKGLVKLGILEEQTKKSLQKKALKSYYPHGIGHWMGIDVHDQAPYVDENNQEIPLQEGMVLTIEPALYIDKNDTKVAKKYRGIGIRIEDNILVVKGGCKNLSAKILKEMEDIETI